MKKRILWKKILYFNYQYSQYLKKIIYYYKFIVKKISKKKMINKICIYKIINNFFYNLNIISQNMLSFL